MGTNESVTGMYALMRAACIAIRPNTALQMQKFLFRKLDMFGVTSTEKFLHLALLTQNLLSFLMLPSCCFFHEATSVSL